MLEHCCKPNANYETYGNKLMLTAIVPIASGQSISINYLEPYLPKAERLEQLAQRYHFECKCELCLPEARDLTRGFYCKQSKCDGLVYPNNLGTDVSHWVCFKCSKPITPELFNEILELEKDLKSKYFFRNPSWRITRRRLYSSISLFITPGSGSPRKTIISTPPRPL